MPHQEKSRADSFLGGRHSKASVLGRRIPIPRTQATRRTVSLSCLRVVVSSSHWVIARIVLAGGVGGSCALRRRR